MLGQSPRPWTDIKTTLGEHLIFTGMQPYHNNHPSYCEQLLRTEQNNVQAQKNHLNGVSHMSLTNLEIDMSKNSQFTADSMIMQRCVTIERPNYACTLLEHFNTGNDHRRRMNPTANVDPHIESVKYL